MKYRILILLSVVMILGTALPASAHINQHCTVGFYKNHSKFINSGSCTRFVFDANTLVSALFPDVDSCVGSLTLLQLLQGSTTVCGAGSTIPGAEVILLRQAIARISNATNSTPISCDGVFGTLQQSNAAIDDAISTDSRSELISLSQIYDTLNQGDCTLH
jgi:hypothetical protein